MSEQIEITSDIAVFKAPLAITNLDEFQEVNNEVDRLKTTLKAIEADEKTLTAPLNESLKNIRAKYKPVKEQLTASITKGRSALNEFKRLEDEKRAADQKALEELAAEGASVTELVSVVDEAPSLGGRLTTIVEADFDQLTPEYKSDLLARVWDAAMVVVRKDVAAGRVETGVSVRKEKVL